MIGILKFEKRPINSKVLLKMGAPESPPPSIEKLALSTPTSIGVINFVLPALIITLSNNEAISPTFNKVSLGTSGEILMEMTLLRISLNSTSNNSNISGFWPLQPFYYQEFPGL